MYDKIVNPQTGRKVSINSRLGMNILKNYLNLVGGHNGPCAINTKSGRCKKSEIGDGNCMLSLKNRCKRKNTYNPSKCVGLNNTDCASNSDCKIYTRLGKKYCRTLKRKVSLKNGNTYATWTRALKDLPKGLKKLGTKIHIDKSGKVIESNFTKRNFNKLLKTEWKDIEDLSDLDLGGGDQGKFKKHVKSGGKSAPKVVIAYENLNNMFNNITGPMFTGGTLSNRKKTVASFLKKNNGASILNSKSAIALEPDVESLLTLKSIRSRKFNRNTALFTIGSTDGHCGNADLKSAGRVKFFANVGFKGTKAGIKLEDSIINVSNHLNKDKSKNTLWIGGGFCFLFLNDNDLNRSQIKNPNTAVEFTADKLKSSLGMYKDAMRGEKADGMTRHNSKLLKDVLDKCSHIKKVIVGSRN